MTILRTDNILAKRELRKMLRNKKLTDRRNFYNDLMKNVEETTRKNNILDLLITNQPDKILRVDVLPGVPNYSSLQ